MVDIQKKLDSVFTLRGPGVLRLPGIELSKDTHEYTYNGRRLSGITSLISRRLKKNFDTDFVEEGRSQGIHVHNAIETYIKAGDVFSAHPAAHWAIEQLKGWQEGGMKLFSEVIVTDRQYYASPIDILAVKDDEVFLFDVKAGNFIRESVTWQLSIYKYFLYLLTGIKASRLFCISTKDKFVYPVIAKEESDIVALLY